MPLIEAVDYLWSRFNVHLVEGGHQLVARIVATITGRFPDGADGEGDHGVKTVMTVSPQAWYSAIDTTGAAPATGRL